MGCVHGNLFVRDLVVAFEFDDDDVVVVVAKYAMYDKEYMIGYNLECIAMPCNIPVRMTCITDGVDFAVVVVVFSDVFRVWIVATQYVNKTGSNTINDSDEPLVHMLMANGLYNHHIASCKLSFHDDGDVDAVVVDWF
jgi:hypothetical protein